VRRYLERLEHAVEDLGVIAPLQIMQSDSGIVPAAVAANDPSGMYLSGPVAGVVGAQAVAEAAGITDAITLDMGGTSTDVSVIVDGEMVVTSDGTIDSLPIGSPIVDIVTVGAGGGSIAVIDHGGMLSVGPQSAGAEPGPACYGQGGNLATLTDALVVLGIIIAEDFVDGEIQLATELALKAMTPIAERLKVSPSDAATEVLDVAVANVVRGCRLVSVERGRDPRDMTLLVYGGLGPTVAALVAESLEIAHVLVPALPGVFSAVGLCMAGYRRDYALSILGPISDTIDKAKLELEELVRAAQHEYRTFVDVAGDPPRVTYWVEARYESQGYELRIPVRDFASVTSLGQEFHQAHDTRYGHAFPSTPVWSVNWGITVTTPSRGLLRVPKRTQPPTPATRRPIWWKGREMEAWWSVRESLEAENITGPAVIAEHTSTTFAPPGWRAGMDASGNVHLRCET
ncbi:MAG: hydantoinase/oxoprolinase family protein, partial [Acidimicrobiia bacterium]|nr:hydantoinase/oxoprolinase family protein [Acidimicrobiia bacterium]